MILDKTYWYLKTRIMIILNGSIFHQVPTLHHQCPNLLKCPDYSTVQAFWKILTFPKFLQKCTILIQNLTRTPMETSLSPMTHCFGAMRKFCTKMEPRPTKICATSILTTKSNLVTSRNLLTAVSSESNEFGN